MEIWRLNFWLPFGWGLCLILSWVGWGSALQKVLQLNHGRRVDWALRAGWGMAVVLLLGGLLNAFRLISLLTGALVVIAGLVCFAQDTFVRAKDVSKAFFQPRNWVWVIPVALLGGLYYFGSIEYQYFNQADDLPIYMPFVQRMLQTGTLIEPFSWRRLSAYGGQQYLQSLMLVVGTDFHINVLDIGLSPLMTAGMAWGMIRPKTNKERALAMGAACLALILPVPRSNAQSQSSGVLLFLTLFRTLRLFSWDGQDGKRTALCVGLVGAAIATLRMNYFPAAALAITLSAVGLMWLGRKAWREHAVNLLISAASFAVCLAPWAWVLWLSSRSLFYPLMPGLQRPEWVIDGNLDFPGRLRFLGEFLIYLPMLVLLLPALLLRTRLARDLVPMYGAALVTALMTAWRFTVSDSENIYRYSHAMCLAAALGVTVWTLRRPANGWRFWAAAGMLLLMVGALWREALSQGIYSYVFAKRAIVHPQTFVSRGLPDMFREAQRAVPEGESFLSVVPPLFFDYRRNVIHNVDLPGAASPEPGMPILQGAEAVKMYLTQQNIHYIICGECSELYSREYWKKLAKQQLIPGNVLIFKYMMPFLDEVDALKESNDVVYQRGPLRVVHLK